MMQQQQIDDIFATPEVSGKLEQLKAMEADWLKIREDAVAEVKTRAFTQEQGLGIAIQFLVRAVNRWEAKRKPKKGIGRFIKALFAFFE